MRAASRGLRANELTSVWRGRVCVCDRPAVTIAKERGIGVWKEVRGDRALSRPTRDCLARLRPFPRRVCEWQDVRACIRGTVESI